LASASEKDSYQQELGRSAKKANVLVLNTIHELLVFFLVL